jgi:hypothetical protein
MNLVTRTVFLFVLLIQGSTAYSLASDWTQDIFGFREAHNFSFETGLSKENWILDSYDNVEHASYEKNGYYGKFRYTFHLPIYRGFGYYLGSSVGIQQDQTTASDDLHLTRNYAFPGGALGLVVNFSPRFRMLVGGDLYLERWEGLQQIDGEGDDPAISVTSNVYEFDAVFDAFFSHRWAMRIGYHKRYAKFIKPLEFSGALDADISKRSRWMGLGIVHHIL